MRVLRYCSEQSHSYPVLCVMRDSGPRCGGLYTILGLSWDGNSLLLCMCEGICVCACMWRSEVNPGSHCSCPELTKWVRLVSQRAPGTCCLHLPSAGIRSVCHCDQISSEELGRFLFQESSSERTHVLCLHQLNQPGKVPSNSTFLIYSILFVPWDSHISVCCLTAHS